LKLLLVCGTPVYTVRYWGILTDRGKVGVQWIGEQSRDRHKLMP